jgi:hypothetical protein
MRESMRSPVAPSVRRSLAGTHVYAALLGVLAAAGPAAACNVPVFRYALERWVGDDYRLTVQTAGEPSDEAERAVGVLAEARQQRGANVDVDSARAESAPPRMVLRYPRAWGTEAVIWEGSPTAAAARAVLNSPARREIATRLCAGESAVWVFLSCGDDRKDAPAAALLQAELARLQKVLRLPPRHVPEGWVLRDEWVSDYGTAGLPELKLAFSMVRVARDDPAERVFVRTLLHSEEDLPTLDEPMAFAVFGRGRCLHALVGKGIHRENIEEACAFLVGWCSCQVKARNPGFDLPMDVAWDSRMGARLVRDPADVPLASLSGTAAPVPDDSGPRTKASAPTAPTTRAAPDGPSPLGIVAAGALAVSVTVFLALWLRRSRAKG